MSLLFQRIQQRVDAGPKDLALVEDNLRWTFAQLGEQINRLASVLPSKGIQPGDKVALMFSNQKEYLVSFFAVLRVGAVVVPINFQLPPEDIFYVLQNSGTKLILTTNAFAPHFAESPIPLLVANQEKGLFKPAPAFPSYEDFVASGDPKYSGSLTREPHTLGVLMYTSGTSGKPKGVMLSEENLSANLDGVAQSFKFSKDDKVLLALPLFHAFGLIIGLYALTVPAPLLLVPKFAPKKIMEMVFHEKATVLPLVPTMFSVLLEAAKRVGTGPFKSLRLCVSGGAGLPPALLKQIEETYSITVLEGYGLTETSPVLCVNRLEAGSIPGSVGPALPNVELKLVDDKDQDIPWALGQESAEGEILAKGPNVMLGYYNLPEEDAQVFTSENKNDRWFKTGDLGRFDAKSNLFISGGRKKDLIIKAGENISPLRIEQVLYQHPAIQEASVIGVPEAKLGEEILACIQLKEGQSVEESELKKFCRDQLPPFMVPEHFRFYDELPKNPTGKILKKALREENRDVFTKTK